MCADVEMSSLDSLSKAEGYNNTFIDQSRISVEGDARHVYLDFYFTSAVCLD